MTKEPFAPKDAETLKSELVTELGIDYEDNEHIIDPLIERELKNEAFKASLHEQKEKNKISKEKYKEQLEKAGFDPETGEKIASEDSQPNGKEEPVPQSGYSLQDIKVLSKIHDDDVEKVEKFAKAEGLSIAEAMKSEDLQAILKYREELRTTAEATNTGKAKRSAGKISEEQIVASAYAGKEVDPAELAAAELALRRKKLQQ